MPSSATRMASFRMLVTTVSTEWKWRFADCLAGNSNSCSACVVYLAVTMRSTSFDRKLRLEIGRYKFSSDASSVGFFSQGLMTASFWSLGRQQHSSEVLHRWYIIGMSSANFFTNQLGSGSSEQCLAGTVLSMRRTSSVVIGSDRRDAKVRMLSTGAGALAVAVRIKFTLWPKNVDLRSEIVQIAYLVLSVFCLFMIRSPIWPHHRPRTYTRYFLFGSVYTRDFWPLESCHCQFPNPNPTLTLLESHWQNTNLQNTLKKL